jgi:hypothetical protein
MDHDDGRSDEEQGSGDDGRGRGKAATVNTQASPVHAGPATGPRSGSSDRSGRSPHWPRYAEAVGEARLAWRWVEGWRARLRKGRDVVEKARREGRLDRQMRTQKPVPLVVVGEPEAVEGA